MSMRTLPPALEVLRQYRQWITYIVVPDHSRPGKSDKFPTDWRTGRVEDAHDGGIWTDFETVAATDKPVGFVFTDKDPHWFLDLDVCFNDKGELSPIAVQLCTVFAGCAIEVSQSGSGLHIFGSGPVPTHSKKNKEFRLELYTDKRFVALTGLNIQGDAAKQCPEGIAWLVASFFLPGGAAEYDADVDLSDKPRSDWVGPADDAELLPRAMRSQSAKAAFGTGASFADLWNAETSVLATAYPTSGSGPYDASSADAALAQHLAFWTGSHGQRIERLMRKSKLAREKWDSHGSYMLLTIRSACARQVDVLKDKLPQFELDAAAAPASDASAAAEQRQTAVDGATFLAPDKQAGLFKGCIYVRADHGVLVPSGEILKPDTFKVEYGGYTFAMDLANERTVRDAFEAFTQSQVLRPPMVASTCFRPPLSFGTILTEDDVKRVNVYRPRGIKRVKGAVGRYLDVLKLQLPNKRDRTIWLSWLAAIVQYPGVKLRWAPVMQGVEGNGKSMHADVLRISIGKVYTHSVDPSKLGGNFNAFMAGKLLMIVEEVMFGKNPTALLNKLKPFITNTFLEIEGKGANQFSDDVFVNWIFFTNFVEGLPARESERRYAHFLCAQQSKADLARDGMTGDFWHSFHVWLSAGGYAAIADYLATYDIPAEFNPAGSCVTAPDTSTRTEALAAGCSEEEQILREAIDSGVIGFKGEWISSIKAAKHLDDHRNPVHGPALGGLIRKLGYRPHPGLAKADGRTNDLVLIDGGKPRLYVLSGGATATTTAKFLPKQVADAYERAQSPDSNSYRGVESGDAFSQVSTPIPPIPPIH